ncbi:hypothetical protein MCOR02_010180 [Pyricularia oryzae]|nr:hypothetical protein MCOR02_010180 [Pyricularia oryzae]
MCSGQHHLSFASEWDELDAPDMDNHHGRAAVFFLSISPDCGSLRLTAVGGTEVYQVAVCFILHWGLGVLLNRLI